VELYSKTVQYPCLDKNALERFVEIFKITILKSYIDNGNMLSHCLSVNFNDNTVQLFSIWKNKHTKDAAVENISDEMRQQIRPLMRDTYNFVQGNVIQLKNI
jgi:hypothetical protein